MHDRRLPETATRRERIRPRSRPLERGLPGAAIAALLAAALATGAAVADTSSIPNFSFIHVSDTHINPHPVGAPDPGPRDRSVAEIAWLCEQVDRPQELEPFEMTAPEPSFIIATGDLTEYGVIHRTWDHFERYFEPCRIPLYPAVGNHDNTWTAMNHIMRQRHGGDHFSFQAYGCHFISINTASIQEPVPSIERRTLTWLENDLARVDRDTPVFIFAHHPLSSGEFAKPYEQLRFLETIRDHHVVLYLMGHGHNARTEHWNGLDSVMGGSTFGPNTGYGIVAVQEGTLRCVYRFRDASKGMRVLLEKPVDRPRMPRVEFEDAPASAGRPYRTVAPGEPVPVAVVLLDGQRRRAAASLNGAESHTVPLRRQASGDQPSGRTFRGEVPTTGLEPGMHFLHVTVGVNERMLERATEVMVKPRGTSIFRTRLPAGMKAMPIVIGGEVIAATTAGQVARITYDGDEDRIRTILDAGVEIINAPALVDEVLYISAAETGVHAVTLEGERKWQAEVGAVVYGTPAVTRDAVYVGDLEGRVHAIDRDSGRLRWSERIATFSIEQGILHHEGMLYVTAWDGFVYALHAHDGSLEWKSRSPAGMSGGSYQSRYYAAADCTPIVVGDRLFVTDRAYRLGSYALDSGAYHGDVAEGVSGIGAAGDGRSFYARGLNAGLTRHDAEGNVVWTSDVTQGRFPIPPTEVNGKVYTCSNRGRLTVHDAESGEVLGAFQVTPQLHVMAPVAATRDGHAIVADTDGVITRVRLAAE